MSSKDSVQKPVNINIDEHIYKNISNQMEEKINADCQILSNAFNHLMNELVPENHEKIIQGKPIISKKFKLNYLTNYSCPTCSYFEKHDYARYYLSRECGIDFYKPPKNIEKIIKRKLDITVEETMFGNKLYFKLKANK